MSNQVVNTVFQAKDKISNVFKRMGKNANRFGDGAENAFKKATKGAKRFDSITKSILKASAIQKGLSLAAQGAQVATQEFIAFDDAIFSASAKFKGLDLTTKKGRQTFKELQDAARKTGAQTQFSAGQAAQALDFLALAGFNAKQSIASLPELANLATAAGMDDFGRVVDIASDSLGAFNLATKDAAQLQINLRRVSDVMAKTQASTNTNVEDFFEAVGKGAADVTAAGQSIETFATLTGVLANSSIKGGESGTKLRNIFTRLSKPTKESAKLMKEMGIEVSDADGNFRDIIDIIDQVKTSTDKMGTAQKNAALATLFGARQTSAVNILMNEGTKRLKAFRKELIGAGGTSAQISETMRKSLGNRIKSLQSAAIEFGFKFLNAFKSDGVNGIDALTNAIRNFDVKPIIDGIKFTVDLFKETVTVIRSLIVIFSPLIAAFLAYKATVVAINAVTGIWAIKTHALTAAQWLLNIALNANPIGLIVAGVVALITVIVILVKKWDVVKSAFVNGGKAILSVFSKIWAIVKGITKATTSFVFSKFLGNDDKDKESNATVKSEAGFEPPNREEAAAKAASFKGVLEFKNKPDNVTFTSKTIGAPNLSVEGLGAN